MKQNFARLIASSGFRFTPGFSGRVMESLKNQVGEKDPAALLTERIGRLFYWVNAPLVAALVVLALLFFLNSYRMGRSDENTDQLTLSEYVYDYYLSNN